MIGNKIAYKTASVSKMSAKELHNNDEAKEKEEDVEITTHKKRSLEERQQTIEELRLAPKKDVYF